ncbi:MAG: TPM domain-containing protein, partial [bacterium]
MRKILIFSSLFFVFSSSIFCLEIPKYQGWVNDYAGVIDTQVENQLNVLITSLEKQTGAEIAVVTLKSLEGEELDTFTNDLFSKWRIGKKDKDNGVLILFSLQDRKVRIETGYGIEPIIPDGLAGQIIRELMIPYFKQGGYAQGLALGTYQIAQIIAKDAGVT